MNTFHHQYMGLTRGMGAQSAVVSNAGNVILSGAGIATIAGGPLAGAIVAVAGSIVKLLASIVIGAGCGQTCITASDYANQAEVLLKQNLNAYMALPTPRPLSAQQQAIANFNNIWTGLQYSCAGVPGAAGTNCIADRQAGACHYTVAGACWNWFSGYLAPIQNDTNVYDDTANPVAQTTATAPATVTWPAALTNLTSEISPLWIGAAVIGLALLTEVL